jgi:putative heme degradation protein
MQLQSIETKWSESKAELESQYEQKMAAVIGIHDGDLVAARAETDAVKKRAARDREEWAADLTQRDAKVRKKRKR